MTKKRPYLTKLFAKSNSKNEFKSEKNTLKLKTLHLYGNTPNLLVSKVFTFSNLSVLPTVGPLNEGLGIWTKIE